MVYEEGEQEILKWARDYATAHGWRLNPDEKKLDIVVRGLARNLGKFGEKYCPCRLRSGDKEKDEDIICPCIYHKGEIEAEGRCHCNLYVKKE